MMLIPRDELLLAVVEGQIIFWGGVMLAAGLYHAVTEATAYFRSTYKAWKQERTWMRILEGKQ